MLHDAQYQLAATERRCLHIHCLPMLMLTGIVIHKSLHGFEAPATTCKEGESMHTHGQQQDNVQHLENWHLIYAPGEVCHICYDADLRLAAQIQPTAFQMPWLQLQRHLVGKLLGMICNSALLHAMRRLQPLSARRLAWWTATKELYTLLMRQHWGPCLRRHQHQR